MVMQPNFEYLVNKIDLNLPLIGLCGTFASIQGLKYSSGFNWFNRYCNA